ncbi:MAG: DivIVA domain-containing protein [Eubacterium sp.]|nr:DivIVA domain-containing protein [Eubacterium sp.]
MLTPNQIREKRLTVVDEQGYDREEVNLFLAEVIESYEALVSENKELYRKMDVLANRIEEYREEEASITKTLLNAQKMADKVADDAKAQAESTIAQSTASAQKIVTDANEKADKIIAEARDFVAKLNAEKTAEAEEIVASAEKRANDAINGAKMLGNDALVQAHRLCKELVANAKAEADSYAELTAVVKSDAEEFTKILKSLYSTQLEKLSSAENNFSDTSEKKTEIEVLESAFLSKLETVEKIIGVQPDAEEALPAEEETPEAEENEVIDEVDEVEETEEVEEAEEIETALQDSAEDIDGELDFDIIEEDGAAEEYDEVDEIIESLENAPAYEYDEIDSEEEESAPPTEEEVQSALDAFTADEITPITQTATSIPEIDDEPEFESNLAFESFFNVDKNAGKTDEVISLIPPEEDEDDETDETRFRGFFKKKK